MFQLSKPNIGHSVYTPFLLTYHVSLSLERYDATVFVDEVASFDALILDYKVDTHFHGSNMDGESGHIVTSIAKFHGGNILTCATT